MTNEEAIRRIKEHIQMHEREEPRAVKITIAFAMAINSLMAWEEVKRDIEFEISIQGCEDIKRGLKGALNYINKHCKISPEDRPCDVCQHRKADGCEIWECDPNPIGMTIEQIDDILQNPKDFWSHEVEEAKEAAKEAVHILTHSYAIESIEVKQFINKMLERRNENRNEN